jgi:hypothetical protein
VTGTLTTPPSEPEAQVLKWRFFLWSAAMSRRFPLLGDVGAEEFEQWHRKKKERKAA